ncbi:hypothetical protein B4N89_46690 [Embleya scabrispora]|uniref:Uncharacterized protein n=1 Tax=Embleya scabrispora TaxID=159449 RepID=A0A1T3NIK9_9ACTN|nr:hypothetical protein [Embleya scabrispora]OPC76510.1 hypothetical protein B4N89_46690 [Embleya scabrispora]
MGHRAGPGSSHRASGHAWGALTALTALGTLTVRAFRRCLGTRAGGTVRAPAPDAHPSGAGRRALVR